MRDSNESYEGNPQAVFDDVVEHLRKQGKQSKTERGECLYRCDKLKCAIGGILPDDLWAPEINNLGVREFFGYTDNSLKKRVHQFLGFSNKDLLADLQLLHDTHGVQNWEKGFRIIADRCNLIYREINENHVDVIKNNESVSV